MESKHALTCGLGSPFTSFFSFISFTERRNLCASLSKGSDHTSKMKAVMSGSAPFSKQIAFPVEWISRLCISIRQCTHHDSLSNMRRLLNPYGSILALKLLHAASSIYAQVGHLCAGNFAFHFCTFTNNDMKNKEMYHYLTFVLAFFRLSFYAPYPSFICLFIFDPHAPSTSPSSHAALGASLSSFSFSCLLSSPNLALFLLINTRNVLSFSPSVKDAQL
jgi:hypothetical protein